MKLTFRGAAGTVTGSLHQLDVDGERILLDCGLFQGRRAEARRRNRELPFPPESASKVVLSHAHIDHSGNLPSLVRGGFSGPIYATPATTDLCRAMLRDSAHIQEKDAEFLNKRSARRRKVDPDFDPSAVEPLYTMEDADRTVELFREVGYKTPTPLTERLSFESYDAGHILGSASILLHLRNGRDPVRLVFSGDIGRPGLPIIRDPQPPAEADYLIMESTYGGRLHQPAENVKDQLTMIVRRVAERGGKLIVPAFAVGRTQQLVLMLHELTLAGRIPELPIFVDSPLAINATEVYKAHPECYDAEIRTHLLEQRDPFAFGRLRYVRQAEESKGLNDIPYPFIVIAASGMCEAGRVLHHLRQHISDPRNAVLITGYQAEHTLGRKLLERWPEVPIFGTPTALRAEVFKLDELSAHADQKELLHWLEPMAKAGLKRIFLVHGEPAQSEALAAAIDERFHTPVTIPVAGQSFDLA
ncbi:MAG: MBL fold metallo-hydrolase [Acidobacteria bacterium]|nr:MBL fold metallo-hydrolase [Acidobacteriota bacterium]